MEKYYYNKELDIDRFSFEKFVEWKEDTWDLYNSYMLDELKSLPEKGYYTVLDLEGRIDLISYDIYKDVKFWWFLLEYNQIIDQYEIKAGDKLRFFDLSDLETLLHKLVVKENIKNNKK